MIHKICAETSSVNVLHHLWKTGWKYRLGKYLNHPLWSFELHRQRKLQVQWRSSGTSYSGDVKRTSGILGNEENLTFLRITSMVENGYQSRRISKNKLAKCVGFSGRAKLGSTEEEKIETPMALSSSFSLSVFLLIVVSVQWALVFSESTISTSPAVLPYINAPDMSSFFPSPTKNRSFDTAASPVPEAPAPGPSSGQFNGNVVGMSMQLRPDLSLVLVIVGICGTVTSLML
ncbi:unnamed protein product [Brassica napus]|uniref:Uncharacterized protein n=4 Tax=Brassica TaxID=3705 RepID=M4DTF0_BRACM|nr:unnamed protein product [Brassica napus]